MKISIEHFYRALKMSVMYWPANDDPRQMINTFAVLALPDQMNSDNLGQFPEKKDTSYFFSRKWAELEYNPSEMVMTGPFLLSYEPDGNINILQPFRSQYQKTQYTIELFVLDTFTEPSDLDPLDRFYTIEDLYIKGEEQLKVLFYILENHFVFASVNGGELNIYPGGLLALQLSQNEILTYAIDHVLTERWKLMLQGNDSVNVTRWSGGVHDFHGIQCSLQLTGICGVTPSLNYSDFKLDETVHDHHAGEYPNQDAIMTEQDDETIMLDQEGNEMTELPEL